MARPDASRGSRRWRCSRAATPPSVVRARLAGRTTRPFRYRDKGNLATIGRARAVADLKAPAQRRSPPGSTWLAVHLWYLIGFQNRLLVFIRWAFSFFTHGRGARLISGPGQPQP